MATVTIDATKIRPLVGASVSPKEAGEATSIGKWVYVGGDAKVYETDADNDYTSTGQVGLIVGSSRADDDGDVAAGEMVDVCWFGRVALGEDLLDETKQYYLANTTSTVNGLMGDAAGSTSRMTGKPESASIFFVNPQLTATPIS